jgi:hypothetical protein
MEEWMGWQTQASVRAPARVQGRVPVPLPVQVQVQALVRVQGRAPVPLPVQVRVQARVLRTARPGVEASGQAGVLELIRESRS